MNLQDAEWEAVTIGVRDGRVQSLQRRDNEVNMRAAAAAAAAAAPAAAAALACLHVYVRTGRCATPPAGHRRCS